MGKRKTQDEIIQGFIEKHGNKYDYSKVSYVEATSEVIVTCLQHGDFKITPNKHKLGQGCLECSIIENSKKKREKGAANIIRRIKEVHGEIYDLSEVVYDKMKSPVTIICKKHGRKQITPSSLIYGKCGCDECGRERSEAAKIRPLEDVLKQATQVHEGKYGYHKIENYTDTQAKYIFVCPVHGEFPQTMADHLSGRGCKDCGKEMTGLKKRLTQEEVIERCTEVHGNRYDLSKIKYITDREPIEIICKKHGSFFPLPINFMRGHNCGRCGVKVSKAEIEVQDFIKETHKIVESNRKILGNGKELDIFIPSEKIAIEYNGLYFHSDKFTSNKEHLEKTNRCEQLGIQLIHIFEDEWRDKQDIVKSRISSILKINNFNVYARKTTIKEVDSKEATKFLEENHIQGKLGAKVKLGLYYNEELVSLMTFGSLRKSLGYKSQEGDWELLRFCNKLNTSVAGGASKLLKYFEENYKPSSLISYADRRWSNGNLYHKIGFDLIDITIPNYFYTKGVDREARFNFRKDVLIRQGFDKNKTEKDIMKERGYNRIYDCGSLKFKKVYL